MHFLILILTCYIQKGFTLLLLACLNGHSDVAQSLINKGSSIDITNEVSYKYICMNIHVVM